MCELEKSSTSQVVICTGSVQHLFPPLHTEMNGSSTCLFQFSSSVSATIEACITECSTSVGFCQHFMDMLIGRTILTAF